jgi:ankyrin repeat protein
VALLKYGVAVDGRDGDGRTALMRAVVMGNKEVVEKLIAHGADLKVLENALYIKS